MNYTSILSIVISCIVLLACESNEEKESINGLQDTEAHFPVWLEGVWQHEDEDGVLFEEWSSISDSTFKGLSYYIIEGDTVFTERLTLNFTSDSVKYISNGKETIAERTRTFTGGFTSHTDFTISNEQLSFPRSMRYVSLNDTSIMIEIAGYIDGMEEVQPYLMVRKTK